MFIESVLTALGRKKTRNYLTFEKGNSLELPDPEPGRSYMLYLHIPFCETLCPYCSFNRIPFEADLAHRYFSALLKEMGMYHNKGYTFEAVYVGGGTPTILPERIVELLNTAREFWPIGQISVETNPDHLTGDIVKHLADSGVNRLSVGVQTFNDSLLRTLGRLEKYGSGEMIAKRLRRFHGIFDTLNVDMIFNFPGQTEGMVLEDLRVLHELNVDQVTYYPLMASRIRKEEIARTLGTVDYRKEKILYSLIHNSLAESHTPVSAWCFSKNTGMIDEYIVDYPEYAGLGSGAFGYLGGSIYSNTFSIPSYISSLEENSLPLAGIRQFSPREKALYSLLMELFGGNVTIPASPNLTWGETGALWLSGALKRRGKAFTTTRRGRYYAVILMREFFSGVNNLREERFHKDR